MKIKDIKNIIKIFFKKLAVILKEIKTLPNAWLYIILAVVLIFVFLIFTFPYGNLIRNELQKTGEGIGRSAYVGKIDFHFFGSSNIENMTIVLKEGSELFLENIDLDINTITAFLTNSLKGTLHINNIKYRKDKTTLTIAAGSGFNLEFSSFADLPVNGSIKLDLQKIIANGIDVQGFDIPPVRFSNIAADIKILKKNLTINECKISGPDIRGNITGSIMLAKFFQQSQLNLNIVIDAASPFLTNYKMFLGKWIDESNNLRLLIRGSIANPSMDSSSSARGKDAGSAGNPDTNMREYNNGQRNVKRPGFSSSSNGRGRTESAPPSSFNAFQERGENSAASSNQDISDTQNMNDSRNFRKPGFGTSPNARMEANPLQSQPVPIPADEFSPQTDSGETD